MLIVKNTACPVVRSALEEARFRWSVLFILVTIVPPVKIMACAIFDKKFTTDLGRRMEPAVMMDEKSRLYQGEPEAKRGSRHESEAEL